MKLMDIDEVGVVVPLRDTVREWLEEREFEPLKEMEIVSEDVGEPEMVPDEDCVLDDVSDRDFDMVKLTVEVSDRDKDPLVAESVIEAVSVDESENVLDAVDEPEDESVEVSEPEDEPVVVCEPDDEPVVVSETETEFEVEPD